MSDKLVWVQQNQSLKAIRIFKSEKAAMASKVFVVKMSRSLATKDIRHHCFLRSQGYCEWCGDMLTEYSGHMHEEKFRGRGGEVSIFNSVFICKQTHTDAHKKERALRWLKCLK